MRKIIIFAVILAFALSLAACNGGAGNTPPPSGEAETQAPIIVTSKTPADPLETGIKMPEMNPPMAAPEYPVIDGSSSTVMMDAAIRAYLTDAYFVDAHSQTYAALERLIPGNDDPADVVLAVKYYDETLKDAEERGAHLVTTPVAKEGFVFILHKGNPIDSLTQRQIRDIYSGKITNWKELGGKDEEIIPYQRNWDSGSQTAMESFMGGEPIVAAEDHVLTISMTIMLSEVERTGSPGIGYNIYSWALGQSLDSKDLKTVAVDGVKPDNGTLADGSYPLMIYTYSYYNAGNEKGKALTEWLLTAEGQSVVASAGYVGIFGELPPNPGEMPDLYRDQWACEEKIREFYTETEMWVPSDSGISYSFSYSSRLRDKAQTEALAGGNGKDVTALFIVYFSGISHTTGAYEDYTRFAVLTKPRSGEWEIISEGEAQMLEDGTMIPAESGLSDAAGVETVFDVEPYPDKYSPVMSSVPGIFLHVKGQVKRQPQTVLFECESGQFGILENSMITMLGSSTERIFGDSPSVHWSPGEDTKASDKITISLINGGEILESVTFEVRTEDVLFYSLEKVGG